MKILLTWQMHEGKLHDTLELFSQMTTEQEESLMTGDVKMIGRWHDLVRGKGVAVFETENAEAFSLFTLNWNKYMDFDVSIVVDDDEARNIGKISDT